MWYLENFLVHKSQGWGWRETGWGNCKATDTIRII